MNTKVLARKNIKRLKDILNRNSAIIVFYEENGPIELESYADLKDIPTIQEKIADQKFFDDTYDEKLKEMAGFIIKNKTRDFICICTYGISRSPACAMAISEYLNHDGIKYFADTRYEPNKEIYNKIHDYLIKEG